jgi:hypothetical protein
VTRRGQFTKERALAGPDVSLDVHDLHPTSKKVCKKNNEECENRKRWETNDECCKTTLPTAFGVTSHPDRNIIGPHVDRVFPTKLPSREMVRMVAKDAKSSAAATLSR